MRKSLEALYKLDHSICLNINNGNFKFGIDDIDHADLKSVEDFAGSIEGIKVDLEALAVLKNHLLLVTVGEKRFITISVRGLTEEEYSKLDKAL